MRYWRIPAASPNIAPLESRSIVSKTNSRRRVFFTYAINPYRGCEFACRYCYARYTHEFLELHVPEDFERKIYFKQNAAWLLTQELARLKPGTDIAIGTATDPYQPLERKQRITRSLLEVFARKSGFRLGIVTKSALIMRDRDLLQEIARRNHLSIHLTVTTVDTELARTLEPRRSAARSAHEDGGCFAAGRAAHRRFVLTAHARHYR